MTEITSKRTTAILWTLAAAYAAALIGNIVLGLRIPIAVVLSISVVFALIHGAVRYGWRGIAAFIVLCLVVSNILENTSILTGFPFGHYHYTDVLGPKLFLVPVLIGPAYFATGYLAWVVGNVLVGEVRRQSGLFTTIAVPFIAAFVMVMWDLTLDPRAATIQRQWIWEQGGGYFGVPFMNYVGWFLTVYIFLQLFAVAVRSGLAIREPALRLTRSHYVQAVVMYAILGLSAVLTFLVGGNSSQITDAAGVVWQTGSIVETTATVSLFTMMFAVALAGVNLLQAQATDLDSRVGERTA
jgi:putative membrane protein